MDIHGLGEATFNQSRHSFDFESSDKIGDGCLFSKIGGCKACIFIQIQDETNMSFDQNFVEKHWQTTGIIQKLPILCNKNQTIEICFPYALFGLVSRIMTPQQGH